MITLNRTFLVPFVEWQAQGNDSSNNKDKKSHILQGLPY